MDLSLYYAVLEHRDSVDPEVVMPSVGWKTGKAKRCINKVPAEPSKI